MTDLPATIPAPQPTQSAIAAHWPEYLCEAAGLGLFMLSACVFTVLFEHPSSNLHQWLPEQRWRMALMGLAMGATLVAIVLSPIGQRSGAHLNPVFTAVYLALGKIAPADALFYVAAQFAGGLAGVVLAESLLGETLAHTAVNYAATRPGTSGPLVALLAEISISFLMMSAVLRVSNSKRWSRWTPLVAGLLVATFITFESPLSGMSMNPARTLASAIPAREPFWPLVYFLGPAIGMSIAAAAFVVERGAGGVFCAKLHHHNSQRCIFRCRFGELHYD